MQTDFAQNNPHMWLLSFNNNSDPGQKKKMYHTASGIMLNTER